MKKSDKTMASIERGITFLTAQGHDVSKIVPDELDMKYDESCILGNIYGSFDTGLEKLGIDRSVAQLLGLEKTKKVGYKELTKKWRKAINRRRSKQVESSKELVSV